MNHIPIHHPASSLDSSTPPRTGPLRWDCIRSRLHTCLSVYVPAQSCVYTQDTNNQEEEDNPTETPVTSLSYPIRDPETHNFLAPARPAHGCTLVISREAGPLAGIEDGRPESGRSVAKGGEGEAGASREREWVPRP